MKNNNPKLILKNQLPSSPSSQVAYYRELSSWYYENHDDGEDMENILIALQQLQTDIESNLDEYNKSYENTFIVPIIQAFMDADPQSTKQSVLEALIEDVRNKPESNKYPFTESELHIFLAKKHFRH